ncbi:MAG: alpha/beta hydrolase family protein [Bacteroides sp.]
MAILLSSVTLAQEHTFVPSEHGFIKSNREDGRFLSSRRVLHAMLKKTQPKYAFNSNMNLTEFKRWQNGLRQGMKDIMCHPDIQNQPAPKLLKSEARKGYTLEKWEFYPLPECVSTFLVLIPDGLQKVTPAVMCIPGSGGSKENLAGEPPLEAKFNENYHNDKAAMAVRYAEMGIIAIVVDNAAAAEASDLEKYTIGTRYHYDGTARYLLELGWSYLGYNSFLDMQVINWMKQDKRINKERIVLSGFSLGTEPLMVLATIDPSIYAFVYNDFLCNTLERAIVMTEPDKNGIRPFPNTIRHLIPRFWNNFNFPDVVAAMAPRPLILTEGGLDRDLNLVRKAYQITGHPENLEIHHYPKFADTKARIDLNALPEGINRDQYYNLVNVDRTSHYFKNDLVIPWLKKSLERDTKK